MTRIVVVTKPLDALPSVPEPTGDDPESRAIARRIGLARGEHAHAIARIGELLGGSPHDISWVRSPSERALADAKLIITVGGDGTFLTVARHVTDTPMLGVNSSPSTSTGHYCGASVETFAAVFEEILGGARAPVPLTRIVASIEGEVVGPPALNDVLFAHRSPVASTRYAIRVGELSELHLSSGVWIATATGSTAAIQSAGGMPMRATDPRLQYRVREPYMRGETRLALTHGFCDALELVSRSDRNALFLDGHPDPVGVPFGARARLARAEAPLFAFISPAEL